MTVSPRGARVLIADDSTPFRRGLRAFLEGRGFAVVGEASNGQEALDLAWGVHPDIAVLDLKMPVVDGVEAARRIAEVCPRTRFVAVTVHPEEYNVLAALKAGITGYVLKSRVVDELAKAINTVSEDKVHVASDLASGLVEAWLDAHSPR